MEVCLAAAKHRARVEMREADIAGFQLPIWNEVINRKYEAWDTEHILIDTAGQTPAQNITTLKQALASR